MLFKLIISIVVLLLAPVTFASNGYFSHGYGAVTKGMGGAGVAWSQDSLAAATNPAGMNSVGNKLDFGVELFSPRRGYEVEGGPSGPPPEGTLYLREGSYRSKQESFVIPNFGYNREFLEASTLGVSVYANGNNTDYSSDTYYGGDAGIDLRQLFVAPTYSWRLSERHAFGVSPTLAYQTFEFSGVSQFAGLSANGDRMSDRGPDQSWGYGLALGWQGALSKSIHAGISYRSKMRMKKLHKYSGLLAEQGGFDIPASLTAGFAWRSARHNVVFDIQHVAFSDVKSAGNRFLPNLQASRFGDDGGVGFGWKDMTIYKLGYQWDIRSTTSLRAGLNYGKHFVRDSEIFLNLMSPALPEWHYTAGVSEQISEKWKVNGVVYFAKKGVLAAPNPLGPGQTLSTYMYQIAAGVSFTYSFLN
ncbi:long-chain fatty acid transport protein [Zhongshania antarctica]|jgi:long-chain fatty acid transport protein|uniref:Long-chain fatty acid transport protein n=1 Tax=Zhongshania antarctica TaxID=641702 RepID=A0A840R8J7_9GAMM|nr:outer membrane protein transport protein [Zhongshania antarctica]MBB5189207.1 long-chain fatty acid transport protein [Zhongshania antarctica]